MAVSNDEEGIGENVFLEIPYPLTKQGRFVALIPEEVQT
jgi:hypothetical protein